MHTYIHTYIYTYIHTFIHIHLPLTSGGVAHRVQGHQQITMEDGGKGIILKVGGKDIVLKKASMGKLECWKLHKPMERIFGDDIIALRRSYLFRHNETISDSAIVFK